MCVRMRKQCSVKQPLSTDSLTLSLIYNQFIKKNKITVVLLH